MRRRRVNEWRSDVGLFSLYDIASQLLKLAGLFRQALPKILNDGRATKAKADRQALVPGW